MAVLDTLNMFDEVCNWLDSHHCDFVLPDRQHGLSAKMDHDPLPENEMSISTCKLNDTDN